MFRLVRFLFTLVLFAAMIWFATSVQLGKRTLWGHLTAIFSSQEAQDLADGTRQEAERVARRVREELGHDAGALPPRHARSPLDPIDGADRRDLKNLVHEKTPSGIVEAGGKQPSKIRQQLVA